MAPALAAPGRASPCPCGWARRPCPGGGRTAPGGARRRRRPCPSGMAVSSRAAYAATWAGQQQALDGALAADGGLPPQDPGSRRPSGRCLRGAVSGKNSQAWWRVSQRAEPSRAPRPASAVQTRTPAATSGSLSMWLGLAWWRLCLSFHHAWLMPSSRLPWTSPMIAARAAVAGDLGVARVVAEEGGAGGQDGERRGEQQRPTRCPPMRTMPVTTAARARRFTVIPRVPAGAAFQQALAPDRPQQGRELAPLLRGDADGCGGHRRRGGLRHGGLRS